MAINSATPLPSLNQYYVWDMLKFGQRYRVQYCVHSGTHPSSIVRPREQSPEFSFDQGSMWTSVKNPWRISFGQFYTTIITKY
ncbi:hypothetical protein L3X38_006873 [Prunus dulcis]|uniref:Uncharacterized protein n=1 Tax=Prunus dulcis TaxID=3755 RepID=A0AAD4ZTN1_PRUDU|nr:hypothetical protein L3X38_006873 [Prunus dulcis]